MTSSPQVAPSLRAERLPLDQGPVVDFRPFLEGGLAQRKRAAMDLAGAFRNMSFAYLTGHGVDQALIDRAFAEAGRFYALAPERKADVSVEKSPCDRGWFDLGMENLDPDQQEEGDLKEGDGIGNDLAPTTRWSARACPSTAPTSSRPAPPSSARPWRPTRRPCIGWPAR